MVTEQRPDRNGTLRPVHVVRWRDPAGKQRERTFLRKADAQRHATSAEHGKQTGDYRDPAVGRVAFRTYAVGWLATKTATRRPGTAESYRLALDSHVLPVFGARRLDAITRADVQEWVNDRAAVLAPATLRRIYSSVVAGVFKSAVLDGLLRVTPCLRIELPELTHVEVRPLTPAQVLALAAAMAPHYRAAVLAGAGLGLRRSELLGLTWDRVDLDGKVVTVDRQLAADGSLAVPKTRASTRKVPLPDVVAEVLREHLAQYGVGPEPERLVFTNTRGEAVGRVAFYDAWDRAVAAAGLPDGTTPHDLRHTYASLLIAAKEHPKVIQARLGHKSIQETFDTYGHLFPESEADTRAAIDAALGPSGQHQVSTTPTKRRPQAPALTDRSGSEKGS